MQPYYQDDSCTIFHGDCRDVLESLPSSSVDLIVTDPPYGVQWDSGYSSMGPIVGDDGTLDVPAIIRKACRVLRSLRHLYVFGPFDLSEVTGMPTTELIWDKGKFSAGDLSNPWGSAHEPIQFGTWHSAESMKQRGGLTARLRRGSVLHVPKQNNGRGALTHPTEKPVLLLRQLIECSSLMGEVVFDPFMGSGTTLQAARYLGRKAIGIEIEERYCEIAAKRLVQGVLDFGVPA